MIENLMPYKKKTKVVEANVRGQNISIRNDEIEQFDNFGCLNILINNTMQTEVN